MEVLCENASRSQECREEPAKGFVSLPGLKVKETHPGAWEWRWQEPGQEDRGGAGRGKRTAAEAPLPLASSQALSQIWRNSGLPLNKVYCPELTEKWQSCPLPVRPIWGPPMPLPGQS